MQYGNTGSTKCDKCLYTKMKNHPIHYSQTQRIGNEIIFSPNKIYCSRKQGKRAAKYCSWFAINFCAYIFAMGNFFFRWKTPLCLSKRPLPRCKSCEQQMVKTLFAKHGEHLLYTIRCMSFFHHFALVSSLFANSV